MLRAVRLLIFIFAAFCAGDHQEIASDTDVEGMVLVPAGAFEIGCRDGVRMNVHPMRST